MTASSANQAVIEPHIQSTKISKDRKYIDKHGISDSTHAGKKNGITLGNKAKTASKGRGSNAKVPTEKKELKYSDQVNLSLIKKFDIEALLDQTGNQIGDCHLPRGKFIQILNIKIMNIIIFNSYPQFNCERGATI
jgi:hypothetical protein